MHGVLGRGGMSMSRGDTKSSRMEASGRGIHQRKAGSSARALALTTIAVVIGIGGRFEAGLNLTGNIQPGRDTTTIVPTIKWKALENNKKSFALIASYMKAMVILW